MIQIVWEFRVPAGREQEFERHYGPDGTWVQLFQKAPGFLGTDLLRDVDVPRRYLTVDRWSDVRSYDAFRERFAAEYQRIDGQMEALTESENRVGVFGLTSLR